MSNDAAGFAHATDRSVASPIGACDAGLRPGPFPDQAASLLPGLLAATRTGLTPAGDNELMFGSGHTHHLRITGRTSQIQQKTTGEREVRPGFRFRRLLSEGCSAAMAMR